MLGGPWLLRVRPLAPGLVGAGPREGLFRVDWVPAAEAGGGAGVSLAVLGADDLGLDAGCYPDLGAVPGGPGGGVVVVPAGGGCVPGVVAQECSRVLGLVQQWLGLGQPASWRLVFVTRGAVAGRDLAGAAVQGLVRSAQLERKSTRLNSSHLGISYAVF